MQYEKLNKKAMWCMYLGTFLVTLVINVGLIGVFLIFREEIAGLDELGVVIRWIIFAIVVLSILSLFISPKFRYERYRYCITEDSIDVMKGFIFTERSIVPIERLHKLSVEKGPIDRIFGLAKVLVTTAGGVVTIDFLEDEKAEFISDSLKKKINQIAAAEKVAKVAGPEKRDE